MCLSKDGKNVIFWKNYGQNFHVWLKKAKLLSYLEKLSCLEKGHNVKKTILLSLNVLKSKKDVSEYSTEHIMKTDSIKKLIKTINTGRTNI